MCTNDGLTGLDGVELPRGKGHALHYELFTYDAGVEVNDYHTPNIVDPCGLMAPYTLGGSNGVPQVSVSDGNVNSAPSGADPSLATHDPIGHLSPNEAKHVMQSFGFKMEEERWLEMPFQDFPDIGARRSFKIWSYVLSKEG